MMAEEQRDVFLSCFKCGRIVRASDAECPRCGLQFGPGTLFECPFCSGLVWRNATKCSTCGIDLTEFSESVEKTYAGFDMDEFVENIINTELEQIKSMVRRVACPGCGLMIRGDEVNCPRCDLPLAEAKVECPVCSEKMPISSKSCPNCHAVFQDAEPEYVEEEPTLSAEEMELLGKMVSPEEDAQPTVADAVVGPSAEEMPEVRPKRAATKKSSPPVKKKPVAKVTKKPVRKPAKKAEPAKPSRKTPAKVAKKRPASGPAKKARPTKPARAKPAKAPKKAKPAKSKKKKR
jgi:RNA polymerase subunit RPABC4/transcription elongation factor Spt4